ncbi:MAG: hypothetical protein JSV80_18150, partial [Acidobacteriota bacterium]
EQMTDFQFCLLIREERAAAAGWSLSSVKGRGWEGVLVRQSASTLNRPPRRRRVVRLRADPS